MLTIGEEIQSVRAELQQFDAKQIDFAIRFHVAVVDAKLRAALDGRGDPIFCERLRVSIDDLAASIRNPGTGCGSVRCLFCQAVLKSKTQVYEFRSSPDPSSNIKW
jgi:hypothetical protein